MLAKKKIGTQVDPALHQQLKILSAITGRRMDSLIEEALRQLTAGVPQDNYVTFEQMHAEYERRHGLVIDIPAEAQKLKVAGRSKRRKRS